MAKLKRIHVNQHVIRKNNKTGDRLPVLTCKTYTGNQLANQVNILDENDQVIAKVVYRPDKPLSCGAVCWVETRNEISLE